MSSSGTPVFSAIDDGVSPGLTVYRRGPLRSRPLSFSPPVGVLVGRVSVARFGDSLSGAVEVDVTTMKRAIPKANSASGARNRAGLRGAIEGDDSDAGGGSDAVLRQVPRPARAAVRPRRGPLPEGRRQRARGRGRWSARR